MVMTHLGLQRAVNHAMCGTKTEENTTLRKYNYLGIEGNRSTKTIGNGE
jgi:hypothetical protein